MLTQTVVGAVMVGSSRARGQASFNRRTRSSFAPLASTRSSATFPIELPLVEDPPGVFVFDSTAMPAGLLGKGGDPTNCVLVCDPLDAGACSGGATCQEVAMEGVGVCTHPV